MPFSVIFIGGDPARILRRCRAGIGEPDIRRVKLPEPLESLFSIILHLFSMCNFVRLLTHMITIEMQSSFSIIKIKTFIFWDYYVQLIALPYDGFVLTYFLCVISADCFTVTECLYQMELPNILYSLRKHDHVSFHSAFCLLNCTAGLD